jgi:hypothetical protein
MLACRARTSGFVAKSTVSRGACGIAEKVAFWEVEWVKVRIGDGGEGGDMGL